MTNSNVYTENLADFGQRERALLAEILALPLPEQFSDDGVKAALNRNSGYVFLVNADYQCAMINAETGKLEIFHSTPYEGHEGFISDLLTEYAPKDLNDDDVEYIRDNAKNEGIELPENWKQTA